MLVVEMHLTLQDVAYLRFAISPSWELVASLRALAVPGAHVVNLPWVQRHRREVLSRADLAALVALHRGHGQIPGFLAAAPRELVGDPHSEIDEVRGVDPAVVSAEIRAVFGKASPEPLRSLLTDPRRLLGVVVDQMHQYWDLAIASHWNRMAGILEGDVVYRGRALALTGPAALLNELHPAVKWSAAGTLTIGTSGSNISHALSGRGLTLVPSIFAWPHVFAKAADPWQPVLRYPARGVGALWERPGREDGCDLAASMGQTRARLLALTGQPMTTTQLAQATGLAAGGVSVQLDRLVRSGLLVRSRQGRTVAYVRTGKAEVLLS